VCRAPPCPMLRTFSLSWLSMTSACCLHNFVIKLYTYGMLKAVCNWRTGVRLKWNLAEHTEFYFPQGCQFIVSGVIIAKLRTYVSFVSQLDSIVLPLDVWVRRDRLPWYCGLKYTYCIGVLNGRGKLRYYAEQYLPYCRLPTTNLYNVFRHTLHRLGHIAKKRGGGHIHK
jgi:hypothetical protein